MRGFIPGLGSSFFELDGWSLSGLAGGVRQGQLLPPCDLITAIIDLDVYCGVSHGGYRCS